MRVLLASFPSVTLLGGGVEVQVRSLQRVLAGRGVSAELFDPWARYDPKGIDIFHLFGAHVGTYHLGRSAHSLGLPLLVTPVFFSRHSSKRVAAMLSVAKRFKSRGGLWTEHMFCKELCDMARLVLPNTSEEVAMVNMAFGVSLEKMALLPNGVEERFREATPELFVDEYRKEGFVLYVGHVGWGRKNLLKLLKVLGRLNRTAVIIGTVVDNEYGRQCVNLTDSMPNVTLIPGLPSDSPLLASAYAACDTFVLPSLYETPGLAALEAGLAGAKICITKYGGTTEYFGELATYLEPGSEESIERALTESLARPRDTRLQDRIVQKYLWRHAGEKLLDAYGRLGMRTG